MPAFLVMVAGAIAGVAWFIVEGKWFELAVLAFCCVGIALYDWAQEKWLGPSGVPLWIGTTGSGTTKAPPQRSRWLDRVNPLRGRSPLTVFLSTLFLYGSAVAALWLLYGDDPAESIVYVIVVTAIWFRWVWRA